MSRRKYKAVIKNSELSLYWFAVPEHTRTIAQNKGERYHGRRTGPQPHQAAHRGGRTALFEGRPERQGSEPAPEDESRAGSVLGPPAAEAGAARARRARTRTMRR